MASWGAGPSPFEVMRPCPVVDMVGREGEAKELRQWARAGRPVTLLGPRRYGKTSLLHKVAGDARRKDGMAAVVVDLFEVVSLADLVIRLERAYRDQLLGPARRRAATVFAAGQLGLSLNAPGIKLAFQQSPKADALPALHALLDLPVRIHAGRRSPSCLVILDEFQALGRVEGAEGILRSHIQGQGETASYIFAGSEPGMLTAMFTEPDRPFYAQAEILHLKGLDDVDVAPYVEERFLRTNRSAAEMLPALLGVARGHPQRTMLLAHCLWQATPDGSAASEKEWLATLRAAAERTAPEHEARWVGLSANQQRVLRAIVAFGSPFRGAAKTALDLPTGSVNRTLAQLSAHGVVSGGGDVPLVLVDPLFVRWIDARFNHAELEPEEAN